MRLFIVAFLLALAAYIFSVPESHLLTFDNTRKAIKMFRKGQILSNPPRLNPVHLSLANTAYRIQSQTLGIPDRFGIFSAGPPRLQVWEAERAVLVGVILSLSALYVICTLLLFWAMEMRKFEKVRLYFIGLWVVEVFVCWVLCIQKTDKRARGYVWKDWSVENKSTAAMVVN